MDVLIIGGGPAGLFAAYKLMDADVNVTLVDEGKPALDRVCPMASTSICVNCKPCDIMCGLGGSGLFSDGTLNLRPDIGGDLKNLTGNEDIAWDLICEVDEIFLAHGAPQKKYGLDPEKTAELEKRSASSDIKFIKIPQRHIGSENTPSVIDSIVRKLVENNVTIHSGKLVEDLIVEGGVCKGVKFADGSSFFADKILMAPGRVGAKWIEGMVEKHNISFTYGPIDIGVRVEVPSLIMEDVISVNHDPKFHIRTKTYDDFVRTFCTNYDGWVVKENYDGLCGVNGHSKINEKSGKTNFAFLVKVMLTEPVENTVEYGRAIADLATTIGGGKPILQRLGDLRHGRRTHPQNILDHPFKPTLVEYTCGDISMALPHRVVTDILEGLEKLNEVIPGVYSDSTVLYAPEIKFYSMMVDVDKHLKTNIDGLYVAGDGVGLSRDIVNAAACGLLAAKGMLKE